LMSEMMWRWFWTDYS